MRQGTKARRHQGTKGQGVGHSPCLRASAPSCLHSPGFTLTEILIVITLIVIVLALALPAFNFITGSRSTDAAQNQISALLGRARNEAIGVQEPRGVFFFLDPATDRYTVALVQKPSFGAYDNNTLYKAGDYVQNLSGTITHYYVAMTDVQGTTPSDNGNTWAETDQYAIDLVPGVDQLKLPPGVAVQVLTDGTFTNSPPVRNSDGYLKYGVILFDSSGRVAHDQFSVCYGGLLGTQMGLADRTKNPNKFNYTSLTTTSPNKSAGVNGTPAPQLNSSFGFVLYERDPFQNQGFNSNNANDYSIRFPIGGNTPSSYNNGELQEEQWLDQNATPVLINRYNGTLIKGE